MKLMARKKQNVWVLLLTCIIFMMSVRTLHDTNTATGAGYLLFLKTGYFSRYVWELLLDVIILCAALLMILIPVRIWRTKAEDVSVFILLCCACIPLIRPDILIIPFFQERVAVNGREIISLLQQYGPRQIISAVLLLIFVSMDEGYELIHKSRLVSVVVISGMLFVTGAVLTGIHDHLFFLSSYVLLLPCLKLFTLLKTEGKVLFALSLFVTDLWKFYSIQAQYHL